MYHPKHTAPIENDEVAQEFAKLLTTAQCVLDDTSHDVGVVKRMYRIIQDNLYVFDSDLEEMQIHRDMYDEKVLQNYEETKEYIENGLKALDKILRNKLKD